MRFIPKTTAVIYAFAEPFSYSYILIILRLTILMTDGSDRSCLFNPSHANGRSRIRCQAATPTTSVRTHHVRFQILVR